MSNVVNLNQFRKQKARAGKRAQADANAAKFGRSRAEREAEETRLEKDEHHLDGHLLDKVTESDPDVPRDPGDETPEER